MGNWNTAGQEMELAQHNKKNFAANFMRSTSIACSGEPQVQIPVRDWTEHFLIFFIVQRLAVDALKADDLQTFTDVLNTKEVEEELDNPNLWLYSGSREDEGLSLAELCIDLEKEQALSTLAQKRFT